MTLLMECRVFIDDFENSINKTFSTNFDVSTLDKKDKVKLEHYFKRFFKISANGKQLALKYKTSKVLKQYNVFEIHFSDENLKLKKGDSITVANTLFFREFGSLQSNRISILLDPFIDDHDRQTTIRNPTFQLNL